MAPELKRIQAFFYQTSAGREPVRDWLKGLSVADRRIIGTDIKDVEFAWPLGKPLVGSLGHGLWEVRSSIIHGFVKKTQKTPNREIDLALKRMKG